MKRILLHAAILLSVACAKRDRVADTSAKAPDPQMGRKEAVAVILDELDRTRLGYVETWRYEPRGIVLRWITGLDRHLRLGYVEANGFARRYDYPPGGKVETPLGADTLAIGIQRILRRDATVVVVPTTEKALADEYLAKRKSAAQPPKKVDAEEGSGDDGGAE